MTCSDCHQDNREGAKFCGSCGARLPGQCPACGTLVRASAKFCDECGHELSAAPVVGAPAATVSGAGDVAGRPARAPAGDTPRHLADKIPTSPSALEGQRKQGPGPFAGRIGLNTGPVVVGKIGDDLRMDYTAQGETVNLAARLQSAAPTGGVLISEATHRVVSGYFVTEDAGQLSLKGLDRPVRAFAVTGQRTRRARFDIALERGLTPLVGRATELAMLRKCFEKAQGGRGQVVSLVGEAGVGKSRLAYELRRQPHGVPLTYLPGRCQ